jgi:hypothetical protein
VVWVLREDTGGRDTSCEGFRGWWRKEVLVLVRVLEVLMLMLMLMLAVVRVPRVSRNKHTASRMVMVVVEVLDPVGDQRQG